MTSWNTKEQGARLDDEALLDECRRIAERLRQGAPVEELEAIAEETDGERFRSAIQILYRTSIDANEPEGRAGPTPYICHKVPPAALR